MADYYTNFSFVLPLPNEAAVQYAIELAKQAERIKQEEEAMPDDFPDSLKESVEDWQFDTEPNGSPKNCGIWLHSQYGGIDSVCAFVQHLLKRYNPTGCVTMEWSHDCSKPRIDAYGGGAAIITAEEIESISTGDWLNQNNPKQPL